MSVEIGALGYIACVKHNGSPKRLPLSWYRRDTREVARELLGKRLVRIHRRQRLSGIITEVEAYLGVRDRACHTFEGRRTPRNEAMYAHGGHAYIYLIYGMHHCFNVVTHDEDVPEAVLVRALEPLEGIEAMKRFRKRDRLSDLTTGPGKLGQALKLHSKMSGTRLDSETLFLEDAAPVPSAEIVSMPRIGVDYAGEHARWPLRFYIRDNPYISRR